MPLLFRDSTCCGALPQCDGLWDAFASAVSAEGLESERVFAYNWTWYSGVKG